MNKKVFNDLPLPKPSMGLDAYNKERKLAFRHDFRRKENYISYKTQNKLDNVLDYLPLKLDIENVSRCNFRCIMCQVSDWKKGQRASDLPIESFKNLIDSQFGVFEIKIQGLGEPTLQGEDYFKMIQYARKSHI